MLKAALTCSVVCTAFLAGGHSTATPQDKPDQVVKTPLVLRQVLIPLIGKHCVRIPDAGSMTLRFRQGDMKNTQKSYIYKLDIVGRDFVRLTNPTGGCYIPMSSILCVWTD
jgi:hypothetical protein